MIYALLITTFTAAVAGDQLLKAWAVSALMDKPDIVIIPDFLRLTYVTNDGAMGGIFSGGRWVFVAVTVLAFILGIWALLKVNMFRFKAERFALTLILAGGAGNLIDRALHGEVVDFIYLWIIPVFNLADMCASLGATALIVLMVLRKDNTPAWQNKSCGSVGDGE